MQKKLVLVIFITLSLNIFFYFTQRHSGNVTQIENNKKVLSSKTKKQIQKFPVRLIIPKINVNALIEYVESTPEGEMEVPHNTTDVAWYKPGPSPGEKGNAVIAGHFNGENGALGVFANLYKLKKGDKLYVEDDKGSVIPFVVRESRTYNPGYANDVFSPNDSARLNLITCDGVWDETKKSYTKRLVVFTDIISNLITQ